jgi:hypothetical protein
MKENERSRSMHPPRARETNPAGHAEAKHGVADTNQFVGSGVSAYNDAHPRPVFNDGDHQTHTRGLDP